MRIDIIEEFFTASCTAGQDYYILKERHKIQIDAQSIWRQGRLVAYLNTVPSKISFKLSKRRILSVICVCKTRHNKWPSRLSRCGSQKCLLFAREKKKKHNVSNKMTQVFKKVIYELFQRNAKTQLKKPENQLQHFCWRVRIMEAWNSCCTEPWVCSGVAALSNGTLKTLKVCYLDLDRWPGGH